MGMNIDMKELGKRIKNDASWIKDEFRGRVQLSKSEAEAVAKLINDARSRADVEALLATAIKERRILEDKIISIMTTATTAMEKATAVTVEFSGILAERNKLAEAIKNIIENDDDTTDSRMLYNALLLDLMELSDEINLERHVIDG